MSKQFALLGCAVVFTAASCTKSDPPPPDEQPVLMDRGEIETVTKIAPTGEFWSPFDSTPSPDGKSGYFIAHNENGAAVYSVGAGGGSPSLLHEGDPLSSPFSIMISTDGATLYVVDTGANDATDRRGRIFRMPSGGGAPAAIESADGTSPRSIDVVLEGGGDQLYFSGVDGRLPAVFKMSADGTGKSTVFSGDPLNQPGGVAVTNNGVLYVADSSGAANETGAIFKIEGGAASEFATELQLAFPAGIALSQDESALLVSALDPATLTSRVLRYDLASGAVTPYSTGIDTTTEPAGLHRAHEAAVYSWADANGREGAAAGTGAIYLVTTKLGAGQ